MSESRRTSDRDRAETQCVELPAELAEEIEQRLHHTRYQSVDAYVAVAMELVVHELEGQDGDGARETSGGSGTRTDGPGNVELENDESVEERLDSLGYL